LKAAIKISVNERSMSIESRTLAELLADLSINLNGVAILLNSEIAIPEKFPTTQLRDGDQLEFVHFVGGG
jgi:sulfur carrier protein